MFLSRIVRRRLTRMPRHFRPSAQNFISSLSLRQTVKKRTDNRAGSYLEYLTGGASRAMDTFPWWDTTSKTSGAITLILPRYCRYQIQHTKPAHQAGLTPIVFEGRKEREGEISRLWQNAAVSAMTSCPENGCWGEGGEKESSGMAELDDGRM